jgi:hypothetical protein
MTRSFSSFRGSRSSRRGVATITAITLLGLVGIALAAMGTLLAADARRTRAAESEAQLRQLLLAGAAASHERLRTSPPDAAEQVWEVPLPAGADATLIVRLERDDDPATHRVRVEATAGRGERMAAQVLTYDAASRALRVAEIEP